MIGLPTETDEDVARHRRRPAGGCKRLGQAASASDAEVTVSRQLARAQAAHAVSVVRAWTPIDEIARKQRILRDVAHAASASTLK